MPTYEYRCKDCGHQFDAYQSFTDDPLRMLRAFRFASQLEFQIAQYADGTLRRIQETALVLFAEREDIAQVAAAIRQGVRGYVTSSLSPEVVIAVLRLVRSGGTFVPASVVLQAAQHRQRPEHEPAPPT